MSYQMECKQELSRQYGFRFKYARQVWAVKFGIREDQTGYGKIILCPRYLHYDFLFENLGIDEVKTVTYNPRLIRSLHILLRNLRRYRIVR